MKLRCGGLWNYGEARMTTDPRVLERIEGFGGFRVISE
jgi:hypothetical protein